MRTTGKWGRDKKASGENMQPGGKESKAKREGSPL